MQAWHHVVTFASETQQVEIYEDGCGGVSNGILNGQSTTHWLSELQRYTTAATTTTILPEGTWTFGSGGAGFVAGEMHIRGGPPPRDGKVHDQPLPGIVEVHSSSNGVTLTHVRVGQSGGFNIDLPAGNYQVVGRPANSGIMSMTSKPFTIQVGRTVHVDLLELAT